MKPSEADTFKTVYVLGAGFSVPAGYPVQASILNSLQADAIPTLIDVPETLLSKIGEFDSDLVRVKSFLEDIYATDASARLEDIFSLLDQTIAAKRSCRNYSWKDVVEIDFSLRRSILFLFHNISNRQRGNPNKLYSKIGKYFLDQRQHYPQRKFSILSLNWDDLLEESIYTQIHKQELLRKADVDYCCFTVPLDKETPHTPSFHQKALGLLNIKILKLHGSINWLLCPNCDKIFTGVGSLQNRWEKYATPRLCVCQDSSNISKVNDHSFTLQPFFITPTYLKTFSNSHIQSIWNNAHTEISEADRIVFIGYSLPEADFHLRSLMVRSAKRNVQIEVVLTKDDHYKKGVSRRLRSTFPTRRYFDLFGSEIRFFLEGVEGYFLTAPKNRKFLDLK